MKLAYFTCEVPRAGYRWVTAEDAQTGREGRYLVAGTGKRGGDVSMPLEGEPELFRAFSRLPATEEAFLDFANAHGCLGTAVPWAYPVIGGRRIPGESLRDRLRQVSAMEEAVSLLETAEVGDEEQLRRWIRIQKTGRAVYRRATRFRREGGLAIGGEGDERTPYLRKGDLRRAATFFAQQLANPQLEQHTCSRLVYDPGTERLVMRMVPRNLLGAMWTQLAEWAQGERIYRKCDVCLKVFMLDPRAKRKHGRFCGRKCQMRAYRKRQERARRLRAQGMTPSAIARELDSDTQTVRGWLGLEQPEHSRTRRA